MDMGVYALHWPINSTLHPMIFPVASVTKRISNSAVLAPVSVCTPSKNVKDVGVTGPPKFGGRGFANVTIPVTDMPVV
jgi:hypothetical protein